MEKLTGLENLLTEMGISQQLMSDMAFSTAVAYDKLGGTFQDLKASVGQTLALALKPYAEELSNIFSITSKVINKNVELRNSFENITVNKNIIKNAENYEEYSRRIDEAKKASDEQTRVATPFAGLDVLQNLNNYFYGIDKISKAQFDFIQSLKLTADEQNTVIDRFLELSDTLSQVEGSITAVTRVEQLTVEQSTALQNALYNLILSYPVGETVALQFAEALALGTINTEEAITAIGLLLTEKDRQNQVTVKSINIFKEFADKIQAETTAKAKSTIESNLLSNAQQQLMLYAQMAADGVISVGDAASIMAARFGAARQETTNLVNALKLLRQEQLRTEALEKFSKLTKEQQSSVNAVLDYAAEAGVEYSLSQATNSVIEQQKALEDLQAFNFNELFDTSNEVQQLDLLVEKQKSLVKGSEEWLEVQGQINDTRRNLERYKSEFDFDVKFEVADTPEKITLLEGKLKGLTEGTKEYYDIQLEIVKLRQQLASEGVGGGAAGLSAAEGDLKKRLKIAQDLREALLKVNEDFYKKSKEAEQEYYDNLKEIFDKYNKETAKAQRENEKLKRESRADFYKSLTDVEGIDTQAFSAQYEEAFAEAQRIAQEGKASLSREFLALRQDQISEMMDLEREMADIRADADMPEVTKKNKLEYLQGVKSLIEDAQREQLKQLMEGGDSNLAQLNEELSAEEKRYQEQTQKIALEAKEQADEKVKAAQRATDALSIENKELQKQISLLGDITEIVSTNAGKTAISSMVELPTRSAPIPVPQPVIDQAQGTAVPTPDIIQSHDRVLNETLSIVGIRLEERLLQVISAIDTSKTEIISSIGTMDRSIQQLRGTSLASR